MEELNEQRRQNQGVKETLCEQAENLADEPHWSHGKQLRELQDQWKQTGPAPREWDQQLWERFRSACDRFFTWLDEQRQDHLRQKEALCEEVEAALAALDDDSDMREVASRINDLQQQWKDIGPVPKDQSEEIWQRFRQPCDDFFASRREHFERLEKERQENEEKKRELLERAGQLVQADDKQQAAEGLRALQEEWKTIGPATRGQEGELRRRFQSVCNEFFETRRRHFEESSRARHENLKSKEALCVRLERIVVVDSSAPEGSPENKALSLGEQLKVAIESNFALAGQQDNRDHKLAEIRRVQEEWKKIGPVPREHDKDLWHRYRRLLDAFYEERREPADAEDTKTE
jgi:hypothetical protein